VGTPNKLCLFENFTSVAATEDVALSAPLGAPERKAFEKISSQPRRASEGIAFDSTCDLTIFSIKNTNVFMF
jgi:hypothetical protein